MSNDFTALNTDYTDPFGLWIVTTEGDEEGKSPPYHLGTFVGYLDEIAFALSSKATYSLEFKKISGKATMLYPIKKKVHLKLDLPNLSGNDARMSHIFEQMLKNRPVTLKMSNYCDCVCIHISDERFNELKKQVALAKLTDEERKLLGLTE